MLTCCQKMSKYLVNKNNKISAVVRSVFNHTWQVLKIKGTNRKNQKIEGDLSQVL